MTLWIRIDANIGENPNVWKLADVRGLSAVSCVGHLVMLFGNVAEHAPTGNVADVPDALLERWAGWTGEPKLFAQSFRELFVTAGVVDGWEKRQGALIDRAAKERERTARRRSANRPPTVREPAADKKAVRNVTVRKEELPANAGKLAKAKRPPAPWLGRLNAAWQAAYGGTLPTGSATLLTPVVEAVGEEEAEKRLASYCERTDAEYASVRSFAAKHGAYGEQLGVDPRTGTLNGVGMKALGIGGGR